MLNVWTAARIPLPYKDHSSIYGISLGAAGLHFSFRLRFRIKLPSDDLIFLPPLIHLFSQLCKLQRERSNTADLDFHVFLRLQPFIRERWAKLKLGEVTVKWLCRGKEIMTRSV